MTTTERVAALWALYDQLDALITADEMTTYPALQHLGDLIEDLQLEEQTEALRARNQTLQKHRERERTHGRWSEGRLI